MKEILIRLFYYYLFLSQHEEIHHSIELYERLI
jgi:hypothetical protein